MRDDAGRGAYTWIELQQPTHTEMAQVADRFALPALAVEDAVKAHQRPKVDVYGDVVFVVLKPAHYVDHDEVVEVAEIALFLGPDFVVTVRHGDTDVLRRVRAELDRDAPGFPDFGAASVLYRVADLVVDEYERAAALIDVDVDDIESQVFGPGEDDHSERIYNLKREVAEFRRAVAPLAHAVDAMVQGRVPHVPEAARGHFRDVLDHATRATERVETHDRLLTDILQANVARVTVGQSNIALRQNEDVRKISAWAAIALVPTAVAGVYGMNFDHMPELRWEYGYPAVLTVIVTACTALHRIFRRNGWL